MRNGALGTLACASAVLALTAGAAQAETLPVEYDRHSMTPQCTFVAPIIGG